MVNKFYVYLHRKATDNSVFYVGKGTGKRAWKCTGRSQYWKNTAEKYGHIVDILFDNLSEEDAFQIEKDTILELRYFGNNLCNMTEGGEGLSGLKLSDEHKQKISKGNKGRVKSNIEREKLSKALKGKKFSDDHILAMSISQTGKTHSDETKLKMSLTRKKRQINSDKNTYVFFSENDVFIGNRDEFSNYTGLSKRDFRQMFGKQSYTKVKGWSLLKLNELLILKEILK